MKRLALILFTACSMSAWNADTAVKGYLVDMFCMTDIGELPALAKGHTRACLRREVCARSGYGVLTGDKQLIKFDKDGNEKVKKFIADLGKANDIRVSVTGTVDGDNMTVSKIELQ